MGSNAYNYKRWLWGEYGSWPEELRDTIWVDLHNFKDYISEKMINLEQVLNEPGFFIKGKGYLHHTRLYDMRINNIDIRIEIRIDKDYKVVWARYKGSYKNLMYYNTSHYPSNDILIWKMEKRLRAFIWNLDSRYNVKQKDVKFIRDRDRLQKSIALEQLREEEENENKKRRIN